MSYNHSVDHSGDYEKYSLENSIYENIKRYKQRKSKRFMFM